jgi:RND family efflux transporter MFP subunit
LIVSASLAAAFALGCGQKSAQKAAPPPAEVDVLKLVPDEVRDTGSYLGSMLSRQNVSILPQVNGYVRRIHVRPGTRVEADAPLLEIDARQESAALKSAEAQQSSAAANRELARQTLARSEALYREGLLSAQELERARAQAEAAVAASEAARAQVSQRQVQLQYHEVRAPFAGFVGDVLVRVGDFVNPSTVLTSIAQSDLLEVSVAIPSTRARALKINSPLEVLDDNNQVLVTAPVFFIAPLTNARTQLVEVKAAFRNTVGLRPNDLVTARLIYGKSQALQIPALAVVRQSGQPFAFVVKEEGEGKTAVERRPITLGPLGETGYVVQGGLQEGDRVAISSIQSLRDKSPIKVRRTVAKLEANSGPPASEPTAPPSGTKGASSR